MIKVSDYIFRYLESRGIDMCFSVSGGAAAHLLESMRNSKVRFIFNYHEQACAMAAEGYARITNKPCMVLVTNGPGSSNTITGVVGAYQDSIPMFIISGQVPTSQTMCSNLRQLGVQELDIITIVKNITKYSFQIRDKKEIKYHLDKAYYKCTSGRKGPVWLDIPLDIQNSYVNEDALLGWKCDDDFNSQFDFSIINNLISDSNRPLIVAGNGIHLSNSEKLFNELKTKLKIPCVSSWTSKDLFDYNDPFFIGTFGILGERAANFAIQKADLLIILGNRLSIPNIGYKSELFSPNSIKIMVDIDENEMNKKTLNIKYKIKSDLNVFLRKFLNNLYVDKICNDWISKTNSWKNKYPTHQKEYESLSNKINSFHFIEILSSCLSDDCVVVTDMGASCSCTHQALKTNGKNRLYTSSGTCSMGFGLPGAIGTYFGDSGRNVILVAGDGGFQMSIQELQTVVHNKIPLKIFILNNSGYLTISLMQDNLFNSKYIGSTADSGISSPDFGKIANAYGIKFLKINNNSFLRDSIQYVLSYSSSIICEVTMPEHQPLVPRVQSRRDENGNITSNSLENMFPFLSQSEMDEIMSS